MTKRALLLAYGCEPGKGSEQGTGWAWARMIARQGDVWVITRANNQSVIESALPEVPERDRLTFIYVDLPAWARFWKRGQRGVRLYYLLWQGAALIRSRKLHRELNFDSVWHVTLSTAWLGSVGGWIGPPLVLGPLGGGVPMPWKLAGIVGVRGALYEIVRSVARFLGRNLNPLARLSWRKAALILVQNEETRRWLPRRYQDKMRIFPHVALYDTPVIERDAGPDSQVAIFAGRLLAWKGTYLAIEAVASRPSWKLLVCGSGSQEERLKQLTVHLGVEDRVTFLGWTARTELERRMREEASVLLFPSLHDDAGWIVPEAMACGLPVICIDRGGPPLLVGSAGLVASSAGSASDVIARLARLLDAEFPNGPAVARQADSWTLEQRAQDLEALVHPVLEVS
ncbi:MAG: glycosyltransferase [Actinomycetota bacterium]